MIRCAASAPVWSRLDWSSLPSEPPTTSAQASSAGSWPEGDAYGVLQSSAVKRRPARRRYASTATHSGESDGKPTRGATGGGSARRRRWTSPQRVVERAREDMKTRQGSWRGGSVVAFKRATGFAPCRRGNLSMIEWILAVALNGRQSIEPAEPRENWKKRPSLGLSVGPRRRGRTVRPSPRTRRTPPTVMSVEDEKGPTIFEAAADEEITESHWCVRANAAPR